MIKTQQCERHGRQRYTLTPALTNFKGPTIFIYYRRISIIANIENKEKPFKGLKNSFCYRRISLTGGSVIAGFNSLSLSLSFSPHTLLHLHWILERSRSIAISAENVFHTHCLSRSRSRSRARSRSLNDSRQTKRVDLGEGNDTFFSSHRNLCAFS